MQETEKISHHINFKFREYSLYSLTQRGIPSKYDALTDVQRIILTSAKNKLQGTNSLIGDCISAGYHHGDSLAGAIAKLSRDYDNSFSLLTGDGFFGSAVGSASAPRYTKCKLPDQISEIISKYKNINVVNFEGTYDYLHLDVPLGLCTTTTGIGVGYSSFILPRRLDEMIKFMNGKKADLTPYFKGFSGKISASENNKGNFAWLIESEITFDVNKRIIKILDIPPMMRYDTSLEKLNEMIDKFDDLYYKVSNLSTNTFNIEIKISKGSNKSIDNLIDKLKKFFSIRYTEQFVFTDNDTIVQYETIEDYLIDFAHHRSHTILKQYQYELDQLNIELNFNVLKLKFINYMIEIGKVKEKDILSFLSDNTTNDNLKDRIKRIPAYKINEDEIKLTNQEIDNMKLQIDDKNNDIQNQKQKINYNYEAKSKNLLNT